MGAYFDTTRRLVRDDDYTSLPQTRQDVSIVLWYRPAAIGATRTLISIRDLRTTSPTERFSISESQTSAQSRFSVAYDDNAGAAVPTFTDNMDQNDVWYMAIARYGSNGTDRTYTSVNSYYWKTGGGSPTASETSTGVRTQSTVLDNLVIGNGAVSVQSGGANGHIAEVSVWTKILDAAEALSLTTQPASSLAAYSASCVNYWPLSSDLTDSKGGLTLSDPLATMTFDAGIHPSLSSASVGPLAAMYYSRLRA